MRVDLLEDLERALRNLKSNEGFNMNHWAKDKKPSNQQLSCGTQACAVGLATTLPSWKKEGVSLRQRNCGDGTTVFDIEIFGEITMYGGLAHLLEITFEECEFLFCPGEYPDHHLHNPLAVAERIRKVIDEH